MKTKASFYPTVRYDMSFYYNWLVSLIQLILPTLLFLTIYVNFYFNVTQSKKIC